MANKRRIFPILVIDGGGVRGLMALRFLRRLEEKTGMATADIFKLMVGVSTGAIITSILAVPDKNDPNKSLFTAKDAEDIYLTQLPNIFPYKILGDLRRVLPPGGPLYDPAPLEELFEEAYGNLRYRDLRTSVITPMVDIQHNRPMYARNIKGQPDLSQTRWSDMLVKDGIRGATTAPTYHPAKEYQTFEGGPKHVLIDGGIFGGSVVYHALSEARQMVPPDADILVVHLGTGHSTKGLTLRKFNRASGLGMVGWLLDSLMELPITDAEQTLTKELGENYFRHNADIGVKDDPTSPSVRMSDTRASNMDNLVNLSDRLIEDNPEKYEHLFETLKTAPKLEERYSLGQQALAELEQMMKEAPSKIALTRLYIKAVEHEEPATVPRKDDEKIRSLASQLDDAQLDLLNRMYAKELQRRRVEAEAKKGSSKNAFEKAGEKIVDTVQKIFDPLTDALSPEPPSPENDNDNEPPADEKKKRGGPNPGP